VALMMKDVVLIALEMQCHCYQVIALLLGQRGPKVPIGGHAK
jgi:hypothetical protein